MNDKMFYVHIHYEANKRGYIGYNEETKELIVNLPEKDWADKVKNYLETAQEIKDATGLDTYDTKKIVGIDSLQNLKLVLTRMWSAIDVQVDWSRPVEL